MSASLDGILTALADAVAERVVERLSADLNTRPPEPTTTKQRDFYSEQDLEKRTGVSRRTWQSRRQRGAGPPWVRCGRRILYPRSSADQFLRGSRAS
jgi:hypothetical protein